MMGKLLILGNMLIIFVARWVSVYYWFMRNGSFLPVGSFFMVLGTIFLIIAILLALAWGISVEDEDDSEFFWNSVAILLPLGLLCAIPFAIYAVAPTIYGWIDIGMGVLVLNGSAVGLWLYKRHEN